MVKEITSLSNHVTQTKHKIKQAMERKDTCFCQESFKDRSILVLDFFLEEGEALGGPAPSPNGYTRRNSPWLIRLCKLYNAKRPEEILQI